MLKNKWFYSAVFILIFPIFLYFNLDNNSSISSNQSTDLSNVTNEEMEQVIKLNPDILPMRIALANRYFESYDYSNALIHFMYVAENTNDIDLKSYSLAQIGWMVYESGDELTSMSYINEAVRLSPRSILGSTYKGIIYVQNPDTRSEGIKILESLKSNPSLPEDDLKIINEILVIYEN
jgi:tetratricopeptide (TPR) repeat protein